MVSFHELEHLRISPHALGCILQIYTIKLRPTGYMCIYKHLNLPQFNPELSLLIFTQLMKVCYHHLSSLSYHIVYFKISMSSKHVAVNTLSLPCHHRFDLYQIFCSYLYSQLMSSKSALKLKVCSYQATLLPLNQLLVKKPHQSTYQVCCCHSRPHYCQVITVSNHRSFHYHSLFMNIIVTTAVGVKLSSSLTSSLVAYQAEDIHAILTLSQSSISHSGIYFSPRKTVKSSMYYQYTHAYTTSLSL